MIFVVFEFFRTVAVHFNPFHATGLFLYPLKASENQRFSDISGGVEKDQ